MWVDKVCLKCGKDGLYATRSIPMFTEVCEKCFKAWHETPPKVKDESAKIAEIKRVALSTKRNEDAVIKVIRSESYHPRVDSEIATIVGVSCSFVTKMRKKSGIPNASKRGEGFDYSAI